MTHFIKPYLIIIVTLFTLPSYCRADDMSLLDMDLSSLMQIQITSAGRKEQNLADVPAAVYVIDQEDIHNSGSTSIPELLRMVPGLQVAKITASKWAISSRGFNGAFSNKLLIQIDGRSVYSSGYTGVYWDIQNIMLEDIQRIEVIRGPGATLWGANAVNGVINIITKQASDTLGSLVTATGGNHETSASFRYGKQLNNDLYSRFYLNHHGEDSYKNMTDKKDAGDDWQITSTGFRLDSDVGNQDSWTLQGDLYHGEDNQPEALLWIPPPDFYTEIKDKTITNGFNLLGRWEHSISEKSSWSLQIYYDYTNRDEIYLEQTNHTLDIDFQHRFQPGNRHDIVWGMGYQGNKDDFNNSYHVSLTPDSRTNDMVSAFFQDEITLLKETLWLTAGSKVEYNDYTGFEVQPNLRLLWKPEQNHILWASIAGAIRRPSRAEDSAKAVLYSIPQFFYTQFLFGNSDLKPEQLIAYEAGYRYIPAKNLSLDIALYYNDYKDLQNYYQESAFMPIYFDNSMEGQTHGMEIAFGWSPADWVDTKLSYTYINLKMDGGNNQPYQMDEQTEGSSPQNQVSVMANIKLGKEVSLNLWGRYTDELKASSLSALENDIIINDYISMDANIKWRPREGLEITLAGQNLFDNSHLEFIQETFTSPTEVQRSIYLKLSWNF